MRTLQARCGKGKRREIDIFLRGNHRLTSGNGRAVSQEGPRLFAGDKIHHEDRDDQKAVQRRWQATLSAGDGLD